METPLISVIVPVYKVEKYLDKCVQSIVDQTYKNLEIILVDDGSPDNCPQMCDEWAKKDPRIKVIHKENGGQSTARNKALDVATWDLFGFVDSDDWISLELFEKIVDIFNTHDPDIVEFDVNCVNERGEIYSSTETIPERMLSTEEALNELLMDNINNYMWNKVFKRNVFKGVRFPEGRILEDMAIMPQLFLNAERIYCSTGKFYYYYQRSDSSLHTVGAKEEGDLFLARYERYITLKGTCSRIEEMALRQAAVCAFHLYARSFWGKKINKTVLQRARQFLLEYKDEMSQVDIGTKYKLYYILPEIFAILFAFNRCICKVVKWVKIHFKRQVDNALSF